MKNVCCLILLVSLAACAPFGAGQTGGTGWSGPQGPSGNDGTPGAVGPQGPQGPAGATPTPSPTPSAIQTTVNNENAYRQTLGQAPLTSGLSCVVQAIASGTYLSSSSPGYTAAQAIVLTGTSYSYLLSTSINQPNASSGTNNMIDPEIAPLFVGINYRIVCSGQLAVAQDGYYGFSLSSDDGSILTIDGTQVINNDGAHGITTLSGTKLLESAVTHSFSLQYAQSAGGSFACVLNMNGALLPAANLYH